MGLRRDVGARAIFLRLWLTEDGGKHWKEVSPDLSRETWEIPAAVGDYKDMPAANPTRRGVIYSLGLSAVNGDRLWAGTDDGLIWTTSDGGAHWNNVTPPELKPFWRSSTWMQATSTRRRRMPR